MYYFRIAKPQQFMQDTFVYIRKIGDTTGLTRKQVGKWALTDKNSIPSGYEIDPEYLNGNYAPTEDPANVVKKRLNAKAAVVVEPSKVKPEQIAEDEEEIELTNPLEDEALLTEPEILDDEDKETETKEAEKTELVDNGGEAVATKVKRKYNKRK